MPDAIVFLVHGTFARGAEWTKPQSSLCQAIEAQARASDWRVTFEAVEWSGRNTSQARIDGARKLDARFREACEKFPAAPIFLIGHSHGGSVIAYFYRALDASLRKRVTGSAFLSTPFIATRIRPDWRQLIAGLGIATALLVFTVLCGLSSYLDWLNQWSYKDVIPYPIIALLGVLVLISFAVAEFARRAAIRWGDRVTKDLDAAIRVHETARLPVGHHIFLRATGDEAAVALAIGQFAIWLLGKLQIMVSQGIGRVWNAILRSRLLSAAAGVVAVLYSVWVGTLVATVLQTGEFKSEYLFGRPLVPIPVMASATELSIQILSWPFVLIFLSILLFIVLLFAGILLCLVALRSAGWVSVKDGLFAEIAIEPVPLGEVALNHLDWNVDTPGSSQRHGYTYSNPDALRRIGEWISGSLRRS